MCANNVSCYSVNEDGTYTFNRQVSIEEVVSVALSSIEKTFNRGDSFLDTGATIRYAILKLYALEQEVFACFFLDNQHRLIRFEKMFYGTIDGAAVYPREIVKRALALNAAAVICAHNHPSGSTEPSSADRNITDRIQEALGVVDIRTLDHIVVGAGGTAVSFAERGWI